MFLGYFLCLFPDVVYDVGRVRRSSVLRLSTFFGGDGVREGAMLGDERASFLGGGGRGGGGGEKSRWKGSSSLVRSALQGKRSFGGPFCNGWKKTKTKTYAV